MSAKKKLSVIYSEQYKVVDEQRINKTLWSTVYSGVYKV